MKVPVIKKTFFPYHLWNLHGNPESNFTTQLVTVIQFIFSIPSPQFSVSMKKTVEAIPTVGIEVVRKRQPTKMADPYQDSEINVDRKRKRILPDRRRR